MSQERSAEFLRDGLRAIIKWHGGDATGCNPQLLLDRITELLAAAEAREAILGSKEKLAMSRIHDIASRQLAEPAGAGDAVAMAKICTEVESVWSPTEASSPTAAEVIAELHGCLDTIKHLSAEIGADSGDIAVHGVALLGLAKIARWKEANGGN